MSTLWYVFPNSLTEQIVLIQIPSWRARERERERQSYKRSEAKKKDGKNGKLGKMEK